jgi:hypothetical protein
MKNRIVYISQLIIIVISLLLDIVSLNAQVQSSLTSEQWLEDLEYTVTSLKIHHPHLYYRVTEEDFNNKVSQACYKTFYCVKTF